MRDPKGRCTLNYIFLNYPSARHGAAVKRESVGKIALLFKRNMVSKFSLQNCDFHDSVPMARTMLLALYLTLCYCSTTPCHS